MIAARILLIISVLNLAFLLTEVGVNIFKAATS
jgi:hypothetical protein